jgi:hypothetical protein
MKYRILLVKNKFRLTNPITYLSALIRLVTKGTYNHVAIEVDGVVIESVGEGVIIRSYEDWEKGGNRQVLPLVPTPMTEEQYINLLSLIGKPYGYMDIIRAGWHFIITRRLGLKRKNPFNGEGYICSELATLLLGIDWFIVPNDFQYIDYLVKEPVFHTILHN